MHTKSKRICTTCGGPVVNKRAKQCRACYRSIRQPIDNGDGTFTLPLTRGSTALIDAADIGIVRGYNWQLNSAKDRPDYVSRNVNNRTVYLHRLITEAGPYDFVDHVNRNTLDCRRSNTRIATPGQNMMNVEKRTTSLHRYKGVRLRIDGRAWAARIQFEGKGIHLGSFSTEEQAAHAYDTKAAELFGEYAVLNLSEAHD